MERLLGESRSDEREELREMGAGAAQRVELSALLDRSFGLKPTERFLDDFPVWEPGLARSVTRWGVYVGERLVATAGLREARMKTADGAGMKVGLVGGVATDPEYQGKGLASRLISSILVHAQSRGVQTLILWGSQHELYRRHGFELSGVQARTPLSNLVLAGETVDFNTGYRPEIFESRRGHSCGLDLATEDHLWFSRHRNVLWCWTGEPGHVTAYAAIGRGIDLPGMIHEWGGSPEALRGLLRAIQLRAPAAELLGEPGLFARYGIECVNPSLVTTEFLCMAHSLNGVPPTTRVPFWFWGLDSA
jgi:GNAT superfamily N-acetyltransferase